MLQRLARIAGLIILGALLVAPSTAGATSRTGISSFPSSIQLPAGFRPEGIVIGGGTTFYVGSIGTGAIYRGDLRTGEGAVFATPGGAAIGLAIDNKQQLFVAGGPTGQGRVIDAASGAVIATHQFATAPTFVNDVVVTKDAAWFTDSFKSVLYRVPLDNPVTFDTLPLTGDLVLGPNINVNGIEATPDGRTLLLVQSNTGLLFTADSAGPTAGVTSQIDLGSATVPNGDGLLLDGRRLYVVQNMLNRVAVIELESDLASGTVVEHISNSAFDVPTTIDRFGSRLYAVNARFTTPATPTTAYSITSFVRP
jgi:sugar lactone lactonase YvrE